MQPPYAATRTPVRTRRRPGLLPVVGGAVFLGGIGWGCHSVLQWLQAGAASPLLLDGLFAGYYPADLQEWITRPRSWFGLHRFTMWVLRIPVFACMALTGFLILLAGTSQRR